MFEVECFFGAPCGNRTRITGLEDRRSAVELRTPGNDRPRARREAGRIPSAHAPSARFYSGPIVRTLFDAPPGEPDGGVPKKQKTPHPFGRGVVDEKLFRSAHRDSPRPVRPSAARKSRNPLFRPGLPAATGGPYDAASRADPETSRLESFRRPAANRIGVISIARLNRASGRRFAEFRRGNEFQDRTGSAASTGDRRGRKAATKTIRTAAMPRAGTLQTERQSIMPPAV